MEQIPPPQRPKGRMIAILCCLGGIGVAALLIAILLPRLGRPREQAQRVKCASNLREIGQAALWYAGENGGQLPPDLRAVYLHSHADLAPYVFVCPSHDVEPAPGATPQQVASAMASGGHLGYARTGGGSVPNVGAADIVLAFDLEQHVPKDGARDTGINVLLGDGSVTFVDEAAAKAIQGQFTAGVRPIRLPATTPAAAASRPASP